MTRLLHIILIVLSTHTHAHARDINDLHMIQRDLAELVGEQGEVVVRIGRQLLLH